MNITPDGWIKKLLAASRDARFKSFVVEDGHYLYVEWKHKDSEYYCTYSSQIDEWIKGARLPLRYIPSGYVEDEVETELEVTKVIIESVTKDGKRTWVSTRYWANVKLDEQEHNDPTYIVTVGRWAEKNNWKLKSLGRGMFKAEPMKWRQYTPLYSTIKEKRLLRVPVEPEESERAK